MIIFLPVAAVAQLRDSCQCRDTQRFPHLRVGGSMESIPGFGSAHSISGTPSGLPSLSASESGSGDPLIHSGDL